MWPVERQVEQFEYLIKELDKRAIGYILLVRYLGTQDFHWNEISPD
jgi:hypothetical protein